MTFYWQIHEVPLRLDRKILQSDYGRAQAARRNWLHRIRDTRLRHPRIEGRHHGQAKPIGICTGLTSTTLVTRTTSAAWTRLTFATRWPPTVQLPAWSHRRRDSHSGLAACRACLQPVRRRGVSPDAIKRTLVALARKKTPLRVSTSKAAKHAACSRGVVG